MEIFVCRFFIIDEGLELKVVKRGAAPGGGGEVLFRCPVRRSLKPQQILDQGKIKRIRGVAWATRVSPATANRIIESAKGVLLKCVPDVYIYSDHSTGQRSGKSPGFGLVLSAETTTGVFLTAEVSSRPLTSKEAPQKEPPTVPEDLGVQGAHLLLDEVFRCDATTMTLAIFFKPDVFNSLSSISKLICIFIANVPLDLSFL